MKIEEKIYRSFCYLYKYCEDNNFKGYDPYDGLNSKFFKKLPLINKNRIFRLGWIQLFKKSPFNLRKLFLINVDYNPKAMGLFLSSHCEMYKHSKSNTILKKINFFVNKIDELKSTGYKYDCWGYNFDWESRAFFQPKYTPTIVVSSFVANSLLDAYEITKENKLLKSAEGTCMFIVNELNVIKDKQGNIGFSYSPLDHSIVYNAILLGARLLSRVYYYTKNDTLYKIATSNIQFVANKQNGDGAWNYGDSKFHQWIDNFHTGFNLQCIAEYEKYTGNIQFQSIQEKGFKYYVDNFFTVEGKSKYYSDTLYPIDIHAPSQLIITLKKTNKIDHHKELIDKVMKWTIDNMQSKKGYFYYQINKIFSSRIPYMRWSQAWMMLSLSTYINHFKVNIIKSNQE